MTREQQIGWKSWEIADYKFWRDLNIIWKNIIRLIGVNNGENEFLRDEHILDLTTWTPSVSFQLAAHLTPRCVFSCSYLTP